MEYDLKLRTVGKAKFHALCAIDAVKPAVLSSGMSLIHHSTAERSSSTSMNRSVLCAALFPSTR